ncbi:hypothetical protein TPAR_00125, partial [Tolypocladium paradoxum]
LQCPSDEPRRLVQDRQLGTSNAIPFSPALPARFFPRRPFGVVCLFSHQQSPSASCPCPAINTDLTYYTTPIPPHRLAGTRHVHCLPLLLFEASASVCSLDARLSFPFALLASPRVSCGTYKPPSSPPCFCRAEFHVLWAIPSLLPLGLTPQPFIDRIGRRLARLVQQHLTCLCNPRRRKRIHVLRPGDRCIYTSPRLHLLRARSPRRCSVTTLADKRELQSNARRHDSKGSPTLRSHGDLELSLLLLLLHDGPGNLHSIRSYITWQRPVYLALRADFLPPSPPSQTTEPTAATPRSVGVAIEPTVAPPEPGRSGHCLGDESDDISPLLPVAPSCWLAQIGAARCEHENPHARRGTAHRRTSTACHPRPPWRRVTTCLRAASFTSWSWEQVRRCSPLHHVRIHLTGIYRRRWQELSSTTSGLRAMIPPLRIPTAPSSKLMVARSCSRSSTPLALSSLLP